MHNLPRFSLLVLLGFLLGIGSIFSVQQIYAATTATVTATVTAQNVSITLTTDGAVAYGTRTLSTTIDTTTSGINDSETAQNNGNVNEDFTIKGANSAAWTLAGTAGSDQYAHKFCKTTCDSSPSWTALTTSDQSLVTALPSSSSQTFDLQLLVPTSTSSYTQQSLVVTVTAAAS